MDILKPYSEKKPNNLIMKIQALKALETNYIWVITREEKAIVIDPGQAEPVIKYLENNNITCSHIIITHHHFDHTGGIKSLQERFPNAKTHGPNLESINIDCENIASKRSLYLSNFDKPWNVITTPGHTLDHLCYLYDNHLFCGDTLFSIGCGKILEGTMEQMFNSLEKIYTLPDNTVVYPAHEYTLKNIAFALSIEPDNSKLQAYEKIINQKIKNKLASLPSTLKLEKELNPFLRCHDEKIKKALEKKYQKEITSPFEVFRTLRTLKDHF